MPSGRVAALVNSNDLVVHESFFRGMTNMTEDLFSTSLSKMQNSYDRISVASPVASVLMNKRDRMKLRHAERNAFSICGEAPNQTIQQILDLQNESINLGPTQRSSKISTG